MNVIQVKVNCPPGAWPLRYTGTCCLGILEVEDNKQDNLWLVFLVNNGKVDRVEAMWSKRPLLGHEIREVLTADILAHARQADWNSIRIDEASFASRVGSGKVVVKGDYRVFGRFSTALLSAISTTDIWTRCAELLAHVKTEIPSVD